MPPDPKSRRPRVGQKKRLRRAKPGMRALQEIRAQQCKTDLLLPKLPFQRLVREITTDINNNIKFQQSALECLQESSEQLIITVMQMAQLAAIHAKRITLQKEDVVLVKQVASFSRGLGHSWMVDALTVDAQFSGIYANRK